MREVKAPSDEPPEIFVAMEHCEMRGKIPLHFKLIRPFWSLVIYSTSVISAFAELLYLILDALLIQLFPEESAPKPKQLLDAVFQTIKIRLEREGFTQVARKRTLMRSKDGVESVIDFSAGKYNETGQRAELYIYLQRISSEFPPNHINHDLIWISRLQKTGKWKAEVDLGELRFLPRIFRANFAPRLRRAARIRRAVRLIERHALPWLEAEKN
jgi:hypothetical protein